MYNIKRIENSEECQIERTEKAVSYDKVKHFKGDETYIKAMYRKPDGSIKRFWVEKAFDDSFPTVDAIYVMNGEGKTIDRF